ncbi:M6 family metalloprotease domain-containing protein [Candidatus Sumerlaeota bacterium]|nr:M6 family metalloprotease domain-containing protein [Candidatus Sumerlaeota bacterium]
MSTLNQPDATTVSVRIWGDEYYQIIETLDGYTLTLDQTTSYAVYAILSADASELLSSGVPAGDNPPDGLAKHLRIKSESLVQEVADAHEDYASHAPPGEGTFTAPTHGNVTGLTILIDFSDDPGVIAYAEVEDFCNLPGYDNFNNNGSVYDYFYDVSCGEFCYTNDVSHSDWYTTTRTVTAGYYRALQPKSYYNDPEVTLGIRTRELIAEALDNMDAAGFDFSVYDADEDGIIDALNVFYAGERGATWGKGLWPHQSALDYETDDGVRTGHYQITDMGDTLELGTFCHENGHMLFDWPDLYDYDYDSRGCGRYCLMAYGGTGTNPVQPCAYLKDLNGWGATTDLETPESDLIIRSDQNQFYRYVNPHDTNEYFIIENRQQSGRDLSVPSTGLAIWHVDASGSNSWNQMTDTQHYQCSLQQADYAFDLENNRNYGDEDDLYRAEYVELFSDETSPNARWWNGDKSRLVIKDISAGGVEMSFTFGNPESIVVSDGELSAIGFASGAFANTATSYTLSNVSGAAHGWTASVNVGWLDVSPESGTLANNGNQTVLAELNDFVAKLAPGTHTGAITFTDTFTGLTEEREVEVTVLQIPDGVFLHVPLNKDPGWTMQGGWEYGVPLGGNDDTHGAADPMGGKIGANVLGYNLSGDYSVNMEETEWLQTTAIDCSLFTDVHLVFWRWLGVEQWDYDKACIEVSNDGCTWHTVWENPNQITDDAQWVEVEYDISAWADEQGEVYIRWGMGSTDASWTWCGWNIDEIFLAGDWQAPHADVEPALLDFGMQAFDAGATDPHYVTVVNGGAEDLLISSIELTGAASVAYTLQDDYTSITLQPGESQLFQVVFDPDEEMNYSAMLEIHSNDPLTPDTQVVLFGQGGPHTEADISASPTSINFGSREISAGPTSPYLVAIQNDGNVPLNISSISLTINPYNAFAFATQPPSTATLAAGATLELRIVFDPSTAGTYPGMLTIQSDDPDTPALDIPLNGVGELPAAPCGEADPLTLNFGECEINRLTSTLTCHLTNTGDAALSITAVSIVGDLTGAFQLAQTPDVSDLPPAETRNFGVRFNPATEGMKSAILRITTNDPATPIINVSLYGTGVHAVAPPENEITAARHWTCYE